MDDLNPYRAPSTESVAYADKTFSAHHCPACLSEVTFWVALQQRTPFRFNCPNCKATFRVHAPRLKSVFFGVISGTLLCLLVVAIAIIKFGIVVLVAAVPLLLVAGIALEVWTTRYIRRNGRFVFEG